jgi:hypothetical protein
VTANLMLNIVAVFGLIWFIGWVIWLYNYRDLHKDEVDEYMDFINRVSADDFADWEKMRERNE